MWVLAVQTESDAVSAGPYSGNGLHGDGEFWSDIVPGESLIVAYEPGAGAVASDAIPFRLAEVSHRYPKAATKAVTGLNALAGDEILTPLAAAASCTLDVACYPQYSEPASAVALMVFESGGGSYECSGSLIASAASPAVPFLLTANHCIGTAAEARSLITVFNYQSSTCGGTPRSLSALPRVTGAAYIAGQPMALGDFSLLRLNAFPNVDVKVLGWSAEEIAANAEVTGISHPLGDYKRIAFGQRTRNVTIRFSDGQRMPANVGYQVRWSQGITQSGSSGSPLLTAVNGGEYIAGTLSAGPDIDEDNDALVCRAANMIASYGRFSSAFAFLGSFLTSTRGGEGTGTSVQASLTASPNPILRRAGQTLGRTTLTWQVSGTVSVQIRVSSPNGTPMTGIEGPSGSAETGDWVVDGTMFYLQDAGSGNSSGADKTLASVRVRTFTTILAQVIEE